MDHGMKVWNVIWPSIKPCVVFIMKGIWAFSTLIIFPLLYVISTVCIYLIHVIQVIHVCTIVFYIDWDVMQKRAKYIIATLSNDTMISEFMLKHYLSNYKKFAIALFNYDIYYTQRECPTTNHLISKLVRSMPRQSFYDQDIICNLIKINIGNIYTIPRAALEDDETVHRIMRIFSPATTIGGYFSMSDNRKERNLQYALKHLMHGVQYKHNRIVNGMILNMYDVVTMMKKFEKPISIDILEQYAQMNPNKLMQELKSVELYTRLTHEERMLLIMTCIKYMQDFDSRWDILTRDACECRDVVLAFAKRIPSRDAYRDHTHYSELVNSEEPVFKYIPEQYSDDREIEWHCMKYFRFVGSVPVYDVLFSFR